MWSSGRKTIFVLCVGFLTIITSSGCRRFSCDTGTAYVVTDDQADFVEHSLLTHSPCAPPCWQGIIPGETDEQEVLSILNDLEFVDPDSFYEQSIADSAGGGKWLSWQTIFYDDQYHRNRIIFDKEGIVTINIVEIFYTVTLDELIQVFGNPDGVISDYFGYPEGPIECRAVDIIWIEKGLRISIPDVDIKQSENISLVTPNATVSGVIYFPPVSSLEEYFGDPVSAQDFTAWDEVDID